MDPTLVLAAQIAKALVPILSDALEESRTHAVIRQMEQSARLTWARDRALLEFERKVVAGEITFDKGTT